ncbi:transposase [Rhodopirellula sp. SWK7]|uniref:transposase n=1 Tax=Rhodopirellula sp. SWK7 TaxID=595460 RepID=UPI0006946A18|nr:transposase [Rhodopirellula sp. SWK7]
MVRLARRETIDPNEVVIAHICNRTVRKCFLMGQDATSGKNFDHRKVWIEQYLRQFASQFGIELLGFSILSNHFHLILRPRPDVVASWDNEEVARRWMTLCPHRKNTDGSPCQPTEPEIKSIAGCPVKCQEIRERLSSISWWMRLLCQRIAMRANREENETGRFWQDRYRATVLTDEASLLACSAYVDLNPIRAAMCDKLEDSEHTSVQRRIKSATSSDGGDETNPAKEGADSFLAPLSIDEGSASIGPGVSANANRCSDKGFLTMSLEDYLLLLDWTARQSVSGKRGSTPVCVPPILKRLGLAESSWFELVSDFGMLFSNVAGKPSLVDSMRTPHGHRRLYLRRRARELMTA